MLTMLLLLGMALSGAGLAIAVWAGPAPTLKQFISKFLCAFLLFILGIVVLVQFGRADAQGQPISSERIVMMEGLQNLEVCELEASGWLNNTQWWAVLRRKSSPEPEYWKFDCQPPPPGRVQVHRWPNKQFPDEPYLVRLDPTTLPF